MRSYLSRLAIPPSASTCCHLVAVFHGSCGSGSGGSICKGGRDTNKRWGTCRGSWEVGESDNTWVFGKGARPSASASGKGVWNTGKGNWDADEGGWGHRAGKWRGAPGAPMLAQVVMTRDGKNSSMP